MSGEARGDTPWTPSHANQLIYGQFLNDVITIEDERFNSGTSVLGRKIWDGNSLVSGRRPAPKEFPVCLVVANS